MSLIERVCVSDVSAAESEACSWLLLLWMQMVERALRCSGIWRLSKTAAALS